VLNICVKDPQVKPKDGSFAQNRTSFSKGICQGEAS